VKGWCFKKTGVDEQKRNGCKSILSFASGTPSFSQYPSGTVEGSPFVRMVTFFYEARCSISGSIGILQKSGEIPERGMYFGALPTVYSPTPALHTDFFMQIKRFFQNYFSERSTSMEFIPLGLTALVIYFYDFNKY